jgi:predicted acetyltransferase
MWIRLIDLRAALEARTYAAGGTVTLEVTDVFRPANEGRWTLDVASDRGVASVSTAATGVEADVALDTTDLATAYLGTFSCADLARAGRLAELRPGGVAAVDRLFRTAEAPHSATMF